MRSRQCACFHWKVSRMKLINFGLDSNIMIILIKKRMANPPYLREIIYGILSETKLYEIRRSSIGWSETLSQIILGWSRGLSGSSLGWSRGLSRWSSIGSSAGSCPAQLRSVKDMTHKFRNFGYAISALRDQRVPSDSTVRSGLISKKFFIYLTTNRLATPSLRLSPWKLKATWRLQKYIKNTAWKLPLMRFQRPPGVSRIAILL